MFTLQISFKPLLPKGEGVKSVCRGDCEQQDFCPIYFHEFGFLLRCAQNRRDGNNKLSEETATFGYHLLLKQRFSTFFILFAFFMNGFFCKVSILQRHSFLSSCAKLHKSETRQLTGTGLTSATNRHLNCKENMQRQCKKYNITTSHKLSTCKYLFSKNAGCSYCILFSKRIKSISLQVVSA